MVKHRAGIALLSIGVAFGAVGSVRGVTTAAVQSEAQQRSWSVIEQNCLSCHNDRLHTGNLSLEAYKDSAAALQHPELWLKVLDKLNSGDLTYKPAGPAKHRAERRSLYRRVGIIHEDHRYDAVMRNLSRTGAMIEGLLDVPLGTDLVVDLGEGQLVVAKVRRSDEATQGLEFETPLIKDGADGLCTRHRISPYALAAAGMPLQALPAGHYSPPAPQGQVVGSLPRFVQVQVSTASSKAA